MAICSFFSIGSRICVAGTIDFFTVVAGEDFGVDGAGGVAGDYAIVGISFVTFSAMGTIIGATS